MKQSKNGKGQSGQTKGRGRWIVLIFFLTVCISALFSFLSSTVMDTATTAVAFLLLLVIVFIGILFDMVGVAMTAADEKPFHSMAAKKTKGAKEALHLLRKADRVASICNDVIGDVCGVISGSAATAIVAKTIVSSYTATTVATLAMSALVAGLTVGGKACGKYIAMRDATKIVHMTAMVVYYWKAIFSFGKRKRSAKGCER